MIIFEALYIFGAITIFLCNSEGKSNNIDSHKR